MKSPPHVWLPTSSDGSNYKVDGHAAPSVRPFYNSSAGLRIAQAFWFNTCV